MAKITKRKSIHKPHKFNRVRWINREHGNPRHKTCLLNMTFVGSQSQGNSDYLVGPRADSLIKSSEFICIPE